MNDKSVSCLVITLASAVAEVATDREFFAPVHKDGMSPALRAFIAEVA